MKKFYLLLALVCATLTASAGTVKVLSEDYSANVPSTWDSPNIKGNIIIRALDDGSSVLSVSNPATNSGNRCAFNFWGASLISQYIKAYNVSFEFSPTAYGTAKNQTQISLLSNASAGSKNYKSNGGIAADQGDFLFDLNAAEGDVQTTTKTFAVNGEADNTCNIAVGTWYKVTLGVNVDARTVDYNISDLNGAKIISGIYNVPETRGDDAISMYATGLYLLLPRGGTSFDIDNLFVSYEVNYDVANKPSITMTSINNQQRTYNIAYDADNGEELHATFNGADITGDILDGVWSNNPNYDPDNDQPVADACNAGMLVAWTTNGNATSEQVSVEVANDVIPVPTPTYTIVNVEQGYAKTYKLQADAAQLPFYANISFNVNGTEVANGGKYTMTSQGTVTVTASAFGYGPTTTTIENNISYQTLFEKNYQKMTLDEIKALAPGADDLGWTETTTSIRWHDHFVKVNADVADNVPSYNVTGHSDPLAGIKVPKKTDADGNLTGFLSIEPFDFNAYKEEDEKHISGMYMTVMQDEGIIYASTVVPSGGDKDCYPFTIQNKYVAKDSTKPAFLVAGLTHSYDDARKQSRISKSLDSDGNPIWEPNPQDCHETVVVPTDQVFSVYRYDTAVNWVRIMTAGGFQPAAIAGVAEAANATAAAPVKYVKNGQIFIGNYNALGQQVK